jgi:hypothetical protein
MRGLRDGGWGCDAAAFVTNRAQVFSRDDCPAKYGLACDVWSLGMVAYFMIERRLPGIEVLEQLLLVLVSSY